MTGNELNVFCQGATIGGALGLIAGVCAVGAWKQRPRPPAQLSVLRVAPRQEDYTPEPEEELPAREGPWWPIRTRVYDWATE